MRDLIRFWKDLQGLLAIHAALLALTLLIADGRSEDIRFQIAFTLFVLPGWLLAARWTGAQSGWVRRYCHALITSFLIHGWLAAFGSFFGLFFSHYFSVFGLLIFLTMVDRWRRLRTESAPRPTRLAGRDLLVWFAVMMLVVVVFRAPRSNDIGQFILQQQDAAVTGQLAPSSIGAAGMGIDQAMPRWRANYWHLWPAMMATASRVSVTGTLHWFATIPLAFANVVCLLHCVRSLCGRRVPLWAVALAVFGPVLVWYRGYNAFTYSFRITNSFCLDKDFCLFFLIPAVLYLAAGWLRGARHFLSVLLMSVPAVLRFHPMTVVYLVLLAPFVVIACQPVTDSNSRFTIFRRAIVAFVSVRPLLLIVSISLLLVGVVLIGDAQSFHREIQQVIQIDFRESLTGRPLHYWGGHYAAVREFDVPLDTSHWVDGRLRLRYAIVGDSGLLLVAHVCWACWGITLFCNGQVRQVQRWIGSGVALAMVWLIVLVSPIVLHRFPHWVAGYERLHWFVFVPALVCTSCGLTRIVNWAANRVPGRVAEIPVPTALVVGLFVYSAACLRLDRPTGLDLVRGLNSRLDYELEDYRKRVDRLEAAAPAGLVVAKPSFLRDDDSVLLLGGGGADRYWLMKQGVFWREPYVEAYALHEYGNKFLRDREIVFGLVDRIEDQTSVRDWLAKKQITLLVDRRDGGDAFLQHLGSTLGLRMRKIEAGVWRIEY